jgi:Flp pilus assembly protein CpaB
MNRTRLLLIGAVAIALGAFVSFVVYRNLLRANTGADTRPGVDVVVAAEDLQVGAKIEDRDIKLVHFPIEALPPHCYRLMSQVVGRGVVLPIAQGDFVLPSKLAGENAGFGLPSLIPTGMRAVSVRVNEVVSVAGFVVPGTRVDVLLTGNLASTQGRIQLALRNPLDTQQQQMGSINTGALYRGSGAAPAPVAQKVRASKHANTPVQAPAGPSVYTVEVIEGDKKETQKF